MISNILILIILIYLAIRLLELIALILRRLNRSQSATQSSRLYCLEKTITTFAKLE